MLCGHPSRYALHCATVTQTCDLLSGELARRLPLPWGVVYANFVFSCAFSFRVNSPYLTVNQTGGKTHRSLSGRLHTKMFTSTTVYHRSARAGKVVYSSQCFLCVHVHWWIDKCTKWRCHYSANCVCGRVYWWHCIDFRLALYWYAEYEITDQYTSVQYTCRPRSKHFGFFCEIRLFKILYLQLRASLHWTRRVLKREKTTDLVDSCLNVITGACTRNLF